MKVAKLADTDDIEAYLTTFERQMVAYDVPRVVGEGATGVRGNGCCRVEQLRESQGRDPVTV